MTKLKAKSRILIVDDHPMMRDGLTMRITSQADFIVCGEAATEEEALELVKNLRPDLVLVDISLKSGNGIELVKRIRLLNAATKILIVSVFQESLYAERALRAGALGYLDKQESNEKLIEAIRTVLRGDRFVSPETTQRLVSQALGKRSITDDPLAALTDRELEILKLIGSGFSTSAIADQLFLSTHTVDTHREHEEKAWG
ncbi:response regulator transcription factor [Pirellulaceae bacterium SH501]